MNLEILFITLVSLIGLLFGANYLVKNIVYLGKKINVSNFVIASLTLAFGTTIPELAVSINAILSIPPHPGIAVGNIFGSNIANILLILGVAALIYPIKINYDKSIKIETRIIFKIRIFLFINFSIFSFILNILITNKAWAIISNIIKPRIKNLLKNLYKS